jgi:riboflavin kinase/FMN adenylyltransferase
LPSESWPCNGAIAYAALMQIVENPADLRRAGRKVCLAIGVFDGVHLGHQHVIRQTLADATQHEGLAVVITFDRHPNAVVAPERVPPQIYSLQQKLRAVDALGADATWVIPFDEKFSQRSGEAFVRGLFGDFGPIHSICVGSEFIFGYKRSGDVSLLQALGRELHFIVHGLAAVALDEHVVSSTRIREAIRAGQLEEASQMLGRGYSLAAPVVHGDQLGRTYGFPTANLQVAGMVLPPNGVYAAHALLDGQSWRSVVNLGFRPTRSTPQPKLHLEAHLLDFSGDLYGKELELAFVEKLRDERKFPSLEALREQIGRDVQHARQIFSQ